MTSDALSELGDLARQLRFHAELEVSYGLRSSPYPALPALTIPQNPNPPQASQRAVSAEPRGSLPIRRDAPAAQAKAPAARRPVREPALFEERSQEPALTPPRGETPEQLEARRAEGREKLRALYMEMQGCTLCRLHEGRTKLVFGQGDAAAEMAFVGEGPGYNEDKQGLAFCGASGDLLTKMINAMGLERDEVFIGNVVKCRPPGNRNPQPDEMGTCLPFLQRQLAIVRPRVIVALGKTAGVGLGLLRPDESLGRNRGFQHRWRGIRVMLTYHPAYLLRNPSAKRLAWHDLKQVMPYLKRRRGGAA